MKCIIFSILLMPLLATATNYTWPTANGNILINNAAFGTLHGGDTVFIAPKSGGYRSFSIASIGTVSEGTYIVIYWQTGAFITPTVGSIQANSISNSNWVMVVGMTMNDHIDVAFTFYHATGYSRRMYFKNCMYRGMNGFFPSGPPSGSLPNYTGGTDTTNCFYYWTWENCTWDSLVGANSGNTALWLGKIATNEAWVHAEIKNCYFGHYSSSGGPACYISAQNVWGLYVHDNTFEQLGMNIASPVGHAAMIYIDMAYFEIHHNYFGKSNFANCTRNIGAGHIPLAEPLFNQWSTGYNGRSRFYDNISDSSRKYPMLETRTDPSSAASLGYVQYRTCPEMWNCTGYHQGLGICCDPYVPFLDVYETDSLFMKNCVQTGQTDTAWNTCNAGASHQGCNRMINIGAGPVAVYDTASNRFVEFAANVGMKDSIRFRPNFGTGLLFNQGTTAPTWLTTDYYGNRFLPISIGAVAAINDKYIIRRRFGNRIIQKQ